MRSTRCSSFLAGRIRLEVQVGCEETPLPLPFWPAGAGQKRLYKPRRDLIFQLVRANQRSHKDGEGAILDLGTHASQIETTGLHVPDSARLPFHLQLSFASRDLRPPYVNLWLITKRKHQRLSTTRIFPTVRRLALVILSVAAVSNASISSPSPATLSPTRHHPVLTLAHRVLSLAAGQRVYSGQSPLAREFCTWMGHPWCGSANTVYDSSPLSPAFHWPAVPSCSAGVLPQRTSPSFFTPRPETPRRNVTLGELGRLPTLSRCCWA